MKSLSYFIGIGLISAGCSQTTTSFENNAVVDTAGIVGGSEVTSGSPEIYSTVGLYDKQDKFLCTGTLISEGLILTAGHCIGQDPKQMVVIFKETFKGAQPQEMRQVLDAKRHEDYNTKMTENMADIGVVLFDTSQGLPQGYGYAKILKDYSLLQPGARVTAVGYGLNVAWILKLGSGVLRSVDLKVKNPSFSATEIMVDQSLKRGVCSGDSGGPGYLKVDGQLYLWGVVSRGDSLPIPLTPDCFMFSVYTRVDSYLSWILDASQALLQRQQAL